MTLNEEKRILLSHGGGGVMMQELISDLILRHLGNQTLSRLEDAAVLAAPDERIAFTTDGFVVKPLFFRGGDIGRLAVSGTVNDLAAMGARPLALSLAMIIEEGLPISVLERVLKSVSETAREAGVEVVTGDTKVVERGAADQLFLITSGIGAVARGLTVSSSAVKPGDAVIVTGTIGDHGIAILSERNGLQFSTPVVSDVAPLNGLVAAIIGDKDRAISLDSLHCMRDPTRGGTAAVLNEIAAASKVEIVIEEKSLPVRPEVKSACDLLGFDFLYVPNEGRLLIFCEAGAAEEVLTRLRQHRLGKDAARIGTVAAGKPGRVTLTTRIGGSRVVSMPYGEQLPRIC